MFVVKKTSKKLKHGETPGTRDKAVSKGTNGAIGSNFRHRGPVCRVPGVFLSCLTCRGL